MDDLSEDTSGILLGASVLAFVEVIPICSKKKDTANAALSSAFAKLRLHELSQEGDRSYLSGLGIQWESSAEEEARNERVNNLRRGFLFSRRDPRHTTVDSSTSTSTRTRPTLLFPSEDPVEVEDIPCLAIGYAIVSSSKNDTTRSKQSDAIITNGTLVRILPAPNLYLDAPSPQGNHLEELVGEIESRSLTEKMQEEIAHNHSETTIRELRLRLSLQLAYPILIGTTSDALLLQEQQQERRQCLRAVIQKRLRSEKNPYPASIISVESTKSSSVPSIMRDSALLVHCPHHGAGKTNLVEFVARQLLHCDTPMSDISRRS